MIEFIVFLQLNKINGIVVRPSQCKCSSRKVDKKFSKHRPIALTARVLPAPIYCYFLIINPQCTIGLLQQIYQQHPTID